MNPDDLKKRIQTFLDSVFQPAVYSYDFKNEKGKQPSPTPQVNNQSPPPQKSVQDQEIAQKIQEGFNKYKLENNIKEQLPMEQYIPLMVQAYKKYPVFQKNPYLIPAVSIVETSGGRNWRLNNNPLSWAARVQQAGNYSPQSNEQSIMDMITAVGGDPNRGAGYNPNSVGYKNRQNAIVPYEKFRQSNNLQDFATTYESADNKAYYPSLLKALGYFQS